MGQRQDGELDESADKTVGWRDASEKSRGLFDRLVGARRDGEDASRQNENSPRRDGDASGREESGPDAVGGGDAASSESAETRTLLCGVVDGVPEPALLLDPDGRVTHLNRSALALYDTTRERAVGREPRSLSDDGAGGDVVAAALDRGEPVRRREERLSIGGEEVRLERTLTPLSDDEGGVAGALLVETDVTERGHERDRNQHLVRYQREVIAGLRENLGRFAEGDLTIDPTVPRPERDSKEAREVYEEFVDLNDRLTAATDNIREVVETLTETAVGLNETSESLSANSEEVTASIEQIDASSDELTRGAGDLADDAQRASEHVDDLSASIEEITASIQEVDAQARDVSSVASDGVDGGREAVAQIREANDATSDVAGRIDGLEESMQEVGDIIDIIAGISDQTNLLALNASIEAARAGEAGSGFAVVAEEIKSLAEESQESADDIAHILTDVQDQTTDLVESIEQAGSEVDGGADEVDRVVRQLERIDDRAARTSEGLAEISDAVESQAGNAEEVSSVIEATAGMAEEITASIEEISSGIDEQAQAMDQVARRAQRTSSRSDDLHERVDAFKLAADESADLDDMS